MTCANVNCNQPNPYDNPNAICVTIDGDFVCNTHCNLEYKKQRDHFFNVTVHSEKLTEQFLRGE